MQVVLPVFSFTVYPSSRNSEVNCADAGTTRAEPLTECPTGGPGVDEMDCELAGPMAEDGTCDGRAGTGLCSATCDAVDCG
ncbi:MAG: hypothetical protein JKY37_20710 [Nannocystaceae bacterium]|nr:hypothetical protein [Nannocystaceae bacterium]